MALLYGRKFPVNVFCLRWQRRSIQVEYIDVEWREAGGMTYHPILHFKEIPCANSKCWQLPVTLLPQLSFASLGQLSSTAGLELDTHLCMRLERPQRPLSAKPPIATWWIFAICLLEHR